MASYRITYSMILDYVEDEHSLIKRGENKMDSGHVLSLEFDGSLGVLKGLVKASMKNEKHKVEIHLNSNGGISNSSCSCRRGQHTVCSHRVALLLYGHKNISPTDTACSWKAPSGSQASSSTGSVNMIYPSRNYDPIGVSLRDEDKLWFRDQLKNLNRFTGFYWLLEDSPNSDVPIPWHTVRDSLQKYSLVDDILDSFKLTTEEIADIAKRTTGQQDNPWWFEMKFGRLTASNFGAIIAAISNNRFPQSLYSRLLGSHSLDGVKSLQYGINHEEDAIKKLEEILDLKIVKTGVWLDSSGLLGASPDGLVGDNAIVEIKCPYKHRATIKAETVLDDKSYCFENNMLKESHPYYHQIQGQLHILNREMCHFFVWTPQFQIKLDVYKNLEWSENIEKIKGFYKSNFIKKLME